MTNSSVARKLINNIIMKQNDDIIKQIVERYDLDYDEMREKYLTPNFYDISVSNDTVYNVVFMDKTVASKDDSKKAKQ